MITYRPLNGIFYIKTQFLVLRLPILVFIFYIQENKFDIGRPICFAFTSYFHRKSDIAVVCEIWHEVSFEKVLQYINELISYKSQLKYKL